MAHRQNGFSVKKHSKAIRIESQNSKSLFEFGKTWLIVVVVVVGLSLAIFLSLFYIRRINISEDILFPDVEMNINSEMPISDLLSKYVEAVIMLSKNYEQFKSWVQTDPISDLLTHLRPIQNRITSLTVQASLYEKMQKIRGGPTQFIKSSLAELHTFDKKDLKEFAKQLHREVDVCKARNRRITDVFKVASNMLFGCIYALDRNWKLRKDKKFQLNPLKVNEMIIISKFSKLALFYKKREKFLEEILEILYQKINQIKLDKLLIPKSVDEFRKMDIYQQMRILINLYENRLVDHDGLNELVPQFIQSALDTNFEVEKGGVVMEQAWAMNTYLLKKISDMQSVMDETVQYRLRHKDLLVFIRTDLNKLIARIEKMQTV